MRGLLIRDAPGALTCSAYHRPVCAAMRPGALGGTLVRGGARAGRRGGAPGRAAFGADGGTVGRGREAGEVVGAADAQARAGEAGCELRRVRCVRAEPQVAEACARAQDGREEVADRPEVDRRELPSECEE